MHAMYNSSAVFTLDFGAVVVRSAQKVMVFARRGKGGDNAYEAIWEFAATTQRTNGVVLTY